MQMDNFQNLWANFCEAAFIYGSATFPLTMNSESKIINK